MRGFHRIPASRHFFPSLFLLAALGAKADEFTRAVPVELVRLLTGSELYREMPPGFPPFAMPEGLSVIGAQHRPPLRQVLLRSEPEGLAAQEAVVAALMEHGWLDVRRQVSARATGFVIPSDIGIDPAELCHDEHGTLQVRGETGVENRVYLRFIERIDDSWQGCEAQIAASRGVRPPIVEPGAEIMQYLPDLPPPETAAPVLAPARLVSVMRSAGRPQPFETEVFVQASDLDIDGLNDHYARQLRAQGWRRDAEWAGELTGGSQWTSSPEDDLLLFLSLSIGMEREGMYSVILRMAKVED